MLWRIALILLTSHGQPCNARGTLGLWMFDAKNDGGSEIPRLERENNRLLTLYKLFTKCQDSIVVEIDSL